MRPPPREVAVSRLPLIALLLLAACGEPISPEPAAPPKPKAPKVTAEADATGPTPEEQVAEAYYYNPAGKRDPFQGFLNKSQAAAKQVADDAPPLQRWDVEKFALRGVIWDTNVPRALLVDPDGIGHVVRVGTYVGRNWGKVSSISQDGLVVTEEYETLDGELVVNPVSIRFAGRELR